MSITSTGGGPRVCPATTSRIHKTYLDALAYLSEHAHLTRPGRLAVSDRCTRCDGYHIVAGDR